MRTKGAFEYHEEHEKLLLRVLSKERAQTTNEVTKQFKKIFAKIDFKTVQRLLEKLFDNGKIKKFKSGKITLWIK